MRLLKLPYKTRMKQAFVKFCLKETGLGPLPVFLKSRLATIATTWIDYEADFWEILRKEVGLTSLFWVHLTKMLTSVILYIDIVTSVILYIILHIDIVTVLASWLVRMFTTISLPSWYTWYWRSKFSSIVVPTISRLLKITGPFRKRAP